MDVRIEQSWKKALQGEFEKPYFAALARYLHGEKAHGKVIFPPGPEIFKAFELTPVDQVKVVILGQDPYHGYGQAMGLSFSVPDNVPAPPSLKNIFKEIEDDLGVRMSGRPNLENWARQGVLLLNSILTVRSGEAASHSGIGWQQFTDAVIRYISDNCNGVVFLLWGNYARSKKRTHRHFSTALCAGGGASVSAGTWRLLWAAATSPGTNEILVGEGKTPINWQL